MVTSSHFSRIVTFSCIVFLAQLRNARTEQKCTRDVITIDCARSIGKIVYVEQGKSINLYCIIKGDKSGENNSKQLYLTHNNVTISENLITVNNSTAIKLYIRKPPVSESIYVCRSKNNNRLIDWTAVAVGSKPQPVDDFVCHVCNYESVICTWTHLQGTNEIDYEVTYSFPNENGQYITKKSSNMTFHKDGNKMSYMWTLEVGSQRNTTQKELYFQLKIKNLFGTTKINNRYSQSENVASDGSSQHCPQDLEQPTPASTTPSSYKVVCYVERAARIGTEPRRFGPNNIDPSLCTHIVYADASLDENTLSFNLGDINLEVHSNVTALKQKGVKVILGFFGMSRPQEAKYDRILNHPVFRKRFVRNAVDFVEENNFDGLELVWFFQKCWGVDCGPKSNKPAFVELVKELHDAFTKKQLLLSIIIQGTKADIDANYDVAKLSNYVDWITLDTSVTNEGWKFTKHRSQLYMREEDEDPTANLNFTVHYVMEQGGDKRKFLIELPSLGELLSLNDSRQNGLHAPSTGAIYLSYNQLCRVSAKEWTVVRDPDKRIGPYAYIDTYWLSFDDIAMIRYKSEYVKSMGLGGAGVWFASDDFDNSCKCESYPILKAANRVLRNYAVPDPNCELASD